MNPSHTVAGLIVTPHTSFRPTLEPKHQKKEDRKANRKALKEKRLEDKHAKMQEKQGTPSRLDPPDSGALTNLVVCSPRRKAAGEN